MSTNQDVFTAKTKFGSLKSSSSSGEYFFQISSKRTKLSSIIGYLSRISVMELQILSILLFIPAFGAAKSLQTEVAWKRIDFAFHTEEELLFAARKGQLVPKNANLYDVDVEYKDSGERRLFVTVPRSEGGIPYTLATVCAEYGRIFPYPNYQWHSSNGIDCNGITSAVRTRIDQYHRLWVLDSGTIGTKSICPPQILVFDLKTDTLIHCHKIPEASYRRDASRLTNLVVDISDSQPTRNLVFIADSGFHGLIVYDVENNGTWRAENKLMFPDPDFGTFSIAGEKVNIMDGILGLSMTPRQFGGDRLLYFNSFSSDIQSSVSMSMLLNRTIWDSAMRPFEVNTAPRAFVPLGRRGVQCSTQAMDSLGNIYCVTMDEMVLFSWNIKTPFERNSFKVLANDPEQLQFATGIKVVSNLSGEEELWILTSRYQKSLTGTRNYDEINFRILVCSISNLDSWENACGVQSSWR